MSQENCTHIWDKESGIKKEGKPWVKIPSRYERKCQKCGLLERWVKNFLGNGWEWSEVIFLNKGGK